jgi:hypothetical protein
MRVPAVTRQLLSMYNEKFDKKVKGIARGHDDIRDHGNSFLVAP